MMQACTTVSSHTVVIASGRALRPSQTAMHTSWTPRFFNSVSTCSQNCWNLGALAAVAGPQAEDVAFPAHRHPDDDVDRFVADLAVADLDHQRVDEDHRIHRVQRPVAPLGHLLDHLVGDLRDGLLAHRGAVDLGEVRRDLPGGQPARGQRQHDLVDPGQPPLPLLHDLRLERCVGVAGHLDLHRTDLGQHRLRPGPVAGVAAVPADRIVLVVAEMVGHLLLERGLQHPFRELVQQPVRADQLHPLLLGLRQQLLAPAAAGPAPPRQLLVCCHVVQRVSHGLSPLGSDQPVPPFF